MMSHDESMSETNGNRLPLEGEVVCAFFDGECTPEERAAVEAFLEEGGPTLPVLDEYGQLSHSLKQLHRAVPSPDLAQAVLAQIRPAAARVDLPLLKPRRRLLSIAAGLSGLAAALLVLLWPRPDVQQENTLAVNESQFRYTGAEAAVSAPAGRSFSMGEVADSAAPPSPSAPATAEMEASITSSLAEIASENPLPEVGDVVGYLDENAEELTWVAVTVVDVQTAGDQVQLLLTKHGVESPEVPEPEREPAAGSENQMTFLVEADWDQMEAVIADLGDAVYVDSLAVDAPSREGVPEVLQEYVVTRADPSTRSGGNASAQVLRERVQQRQNQAPAAGPTTDGSAVDEAVQLQLQVPEAVLRRLAARRGVAADLAASEPAAADPAAADTPAAALAEDPAREVAPTALGRPMASRRARAVIVIQRHNR